MNKLFSNKSATHIFFLIFLLIVENTEYSENHLMFLDNIFYFLFDFLKISTFAKYRVMHFFWIYEVIQAEWKGKCFGNRFVSENIFAFKNSKKHLQLFQEN